MYIVKVSRSTWYINMRFQLYLCVSVCVRACVYACMCVCACVCACACACACACVCVCVCNSLPHSETPLYSQMAPMILKLYVVHLSQESQWQSGVSSVPGMSLVVLSFRVCYDAPCNDCTVTVHWLFLLCPYDNMLQKWHCHT